MVAALRIEQLTFSDRTSVNCTGSDVIIVVGPNNAGKSRALREIEGLANQVRIHPSVVATFPPRFKGAVVTDLSWRRHGSDGEFLTLARRIGTKADSSGRIYYNIAFSPNPPQVVPVFEDQVGWAEPCNMTLNQVFIKHVRSTDRVQLSDPTRSIDFGREIKTHPLHFLHQDAGLRTKLSHWFKSAFGLELAVDLLAGSVVPIHVGEDAGPRSGELDTAPRYLERLRSYPRIHEEGDGMRGFLGLLLYCLLSHQTVILIDEPEAFLHPPQARLLARLMADERAEATQIFVATHSADIVRGFLESQKARVKVVRLRRDGARNIANELGHDDLATLWSDPVLRYSNILDGLFHERVVICEADGDCRFYQAIGDALRENEDHGFVRDVMFTQGGGKSGIPKLVQALRKLAVPVVAVCDFDALQDQHQFEALLSAFGSCLDEVKADYDAVRKAIGKLGSLTGSQRRATISAAVAGISDNAETVPNSIAKSIRDALKPSLGWNLAKGAGLGILRPGSEKIAGNSLLCFLAKRGILIVPSGELESFLPLEASEKNTWVNSVLTKYRGRFATAPELQGARDFVVKMIGQSRPAETSGSAGDSVGGVVPGGGGG